jgi:hypothetical protein
MNSLNVDEIHELAKHAYSNYDIQEFLISKHVQVPELVVDSSLKYAIKDTINYSSNLILPYQLIPTLGNIGNNTVIKKIKELDSFEKICEYLENLRLENKKDYRGFTTEKMAETIKNASYQPPLLLIAREQILVVDGRTRLFLAYGLKKNISCNVIN